MYGYEITQHIKTSSRGKCIDQRERKSIGSCCLHKLEADGLLESEELLVGGRTRKYYKLTNKGKRESIVASEELLSFLNTIHAIINPDKVLNHANI
jgi:DNA-binding PadR family transcriptional regulator